MWDLRWSVRPSDSARPSNETFGDLKEEEEVDSRIRAAIRPTAMPTPIEMGASSTISVTSRSSLFSFRPPVVPLPELSMLRRIRKGLFCLSSVSCCTERGEVEVNKGTDLVAKTFELRPALHLRIPSHRAIRHSLSRPLTSSEALAQDATRYG